MDQPFRKAANDRGSRFVVGGGGAESGQALVNRRGWPGRRFRSATPGEVHHRDALVAVDGERDVVVAFVLPEGLDGAPAEDVAR